MRIRSILPDFYRSEDVAAMDWHTRLVFIGLWSYVDDNGVGRDNPRLISSDLFPLDGDPTETLRRVSTAIAWLSEHGQVTRYKVSGVAYLFITKWDAYQRVQNPGKARYPRPTSDNVEAPDALRTVSVESPETLSPGEGEKGRRGEVTTTSGTPDDAGTTTDTTPGEADFGFAAFYAAYPRKEARRKAEQAWRAALKRAPAEQIMAGLARFPFRDDRQFVPLPASWLNADRWADQPDATVHQLRPAVGQPLTREQVADVLGPAASGPQTVPKWVADGDHQDYVRFLREWRAQDDAARERQARAVLTRRAAAGGGR